MALPISPSSHHLHPKEPIFSSKYLQSIGLHEENAPTAIPARRYRHRTYTLISQIVLYFRRYPSLDLVEYNCDTGQGQGAYSSLFSLSLL